MKRIFILTVLISLLISAHAQNEATFWHFGLNAGLDFSSGFPVPLQNSQIYTGEGCSSISSSTGDLLFYTDGQTVWNRNNIVMPNGTGLTGHSSSTQSGIIVPVPGSTKRFYLFTIEAIEGENEGFRYSVVNMDLDGGMGDIVPGDKNILLVPNVFEKVTAVGNDIGDGTWVITHKWGTNKFYAYLVTAFGLNTTPVTSEIGDIVSGQDENAKGYLKVSPDGSTLVKANAGLATVEFFDFNNSTGEITNTFKDTRFPGQLPYGVEFSPNNKLLYISTWKANGKLYQYDLEAGTPEDILNSRKEIHSFSGLVGALQLGPDNKIYAARNNQNYLSSISKPNTPGNGCQFKENGVALAGRTSRYGLPPFVQSFFSLNVAFFYDPACFGSITQFYENCSSVPDSVFWNFGDPPSGANNFSQQMNPQHEFTSPGWFGVKLVAYMVGKKDSVTHIVVVGENPEITLGNDTTFCQGDSVILDPGAGYFAYEWHNGDTARLFMADTSGTYWVKVTNESNCFDIDTINITVYPTFTVNTDTSICEGDGIFISGNYITEPGTYYDSLNTTLGCDSVIVINLTLRDTFDITHNMSICTGDSVFVGGAWQTESGTYYDVFTSANGCDSTINTILTVDDIIYFNENISICDGDSIFIGGDYQKTTGVYADTAVSVAGCDSIHTIYLFVNEVYATLIDTLICDTDSIYAGGGYQSSAGTYYDDYFSIAGCDSNFTTILSIAETYDIFIDTSICEGESIYAGGDYQTEAGIYFDSYLTTSGCDSSKTTNLSIILLPEVRLGNDTNLLLGTTLLLDASFPGVRYLWQDGSTDSTFLVTENGTYYVILSNTCATAADTIQVFYIVDEPLCTTYAPNAFSPNGDGLNDIFAIESECIYKNYTLRIYDRWGMLIYETSEIDQGWDGTISGKPASIGSYVWMLIYKEVSFYPRPEIKVQGVVTLVR